jgi:putative SOS response-associated peptidase YedK
MCGRYTFFDVSEVYERFGVNERIEGLTPRYNAAPGQMMPVVVKQSPNHIRLMRWGLIPSWAKDPKIGYRMINAREETVAQKPSYKKPLSKQRCLVPANGFYEWQKENGKQPYYFTSKDGKLIALAGLYDVWKDAEDHEIWSFTIITRTANDVVRKVHERMPVVLDARQEEDWLNTDKVEADAAVKLLSETKIDLEYYMVRRDVNSAERDDRNLITPL